MDRPNFRKLVFEKLASLNLNSLQLIDESTDALTLEVVSDTFIGVSALKRIDTVFSLISTLIEKIDFHVDIIALTVNEKQSGHNEQS